MLSPRRERLIVLLILIGYVLLALAFSLGPIFEGPDEIEHYRFVRTMLQIRGLPDPHTQSRSQYHQAPLYYLLEAPVKPLIEDADFSQIDGRTNPYYPFDIGIPGNDNKNLYLHTRAEDFPYQHSPTALAVHLMRLISVALGFGTVLASYAIFRLLWPDRPDRRLLALAVVAFFPQFLYLSGTINNDTLLIFLTTLSVYLLLRQHRDGPSLRLAILLGVVLGLALLTKASAAFLVFPAAAATLLDRRTWRYAPITVVIVISIAGWWYLRNQILYGDPNAVRVLLETWKTETIRPNQLAFDIGLPRLPYAYQTFWARFGQGAVAVGQPIYVFFDALVFITFAGLLIQLIRRLPFFPLPSVLKNESVLSQYIAYLPKFPLRSPRLRGRGAGGEGSRPTLTRSSLQPSFPGAGARGIIPVTLIAVLALSWIAMLTIYSATAWSGNQGRYLLPAIAAWGAIIACGLDAFTPRRVRLQFALVGLILFSTVAVICVFRYFLPSYSVWPVPPTIDRPLSLRFGDVAELIGMSPAAPHARPGEVIHVTLYWRALRPTTTRLQSYLHTADTDVVKRDSLPATGNLLSTDWLPGQTWAESYVVPISPDASPQNGYTLVAGLYDPATNGNLPASTDDKPFSPVIGRIAINSSTSAAPIKLQYRFGDAIGLAEPRLKNNGDSLEVCLQFQSLTPVTVDYSVYIHILTSPGAPPITQQDFQPKGGSYTTSMWLPGEVISDCVTLDMSKVPKTGWQVAIGLYDVNTGQRLPIQDADGKNLQVDSVVILPSP